jgi:hypothetical protein
VLGEKNNSDDDANLDPENMFEFNLLLVKPFFGEEAKRMKDTDAPSDIEEYTGYCDEGKIPQK